MTPITPHHPLYVVLMPRRRVRRGARLAAVVGLALGIYLMHGLSGPVMSHDGLPGLGRSIHAMADLHDTASSGRTAPHAESAALAGMGCAYAVLQRRVRSIRRLPARHTRRPPTALRLPIGPLRGPEPPVPRAV